MRNKNLMAKTSALLLALLVVTGCPQDTDDGNRDPVPIPDILVASISIAGVTVTPLPPPAASIADAEAVSVVVNTERPPTESEAADGVYYRPVQPVTVTLANKNQTAFFNVTAAGETPAEIELPSNTQEDDKVTRNIAITLPNDDNFQIGQVVWIRVVAADESKTEFYKFNVINQTHDTAVSSITVSGHDVLDTSQTGHIGPWLSGSSWANAAAGLVNLAQSEAGNVTVAAIPRNDLSDRAKPVFEYAKIPAGEAPGEPAAWEAAAPSSFVNHDILAVRVTASNEKTVGYLKITVNVGGSPFLSALTVNNNAVSLGSPSDDIAAVGGAYRVEEGLTLTDSPAAWAVTPVAEDSNAVVTWALVAKGAVPSDGDFTSPASFDTSHNYLYIKVVSGNSEFTMYYLVVYDERPKDTEHIKTGYKNVPVYRFTIPDGHTWAEMGDYPKIRIKILQEEEEFNISDGYQRHFVFGELSKMEVPHNEDTPNPSWALDTETLYIRPGAGDFNFYMPFLLNRRARDLAIDTPAPNRWFTAEWPLNNPPDWTPPWDPTATRPAIISGYEKDKWWPDPDTTGDVYFGIGITHDSAREYWVKELSLVSEDGSLQIFCDLLGNGRIDSDTQKTGFVETDPNGKDGGPTIDFLRELVSDPTLK